MEDALADHGLVLPYWHQPFQLFIKILNDKYLLFLWPHFWPLNYDESVTIRMDIPPSSS